MRLPPSHVEPQESDLNYREYREQQHQQQSDEEGEGTEPEHGSRTSTPIEATSAPFNTQDLREAFLVRRARDSDPGTQHGHKSTGSRFGSGVWSGLGMGGGNGSAQSQRMGGAAAGWGPKGLAEGIGIDARRYVEDLLSLNR